MNTFRLFDEVELAGEAIDRVIPVGTHGSIVLCFPEDDAYLVDFSSPDTDLKETVVHADDVVLIRHYEETGDMPLDPMQPEKTQRQGALIG